MVFRKGDPKPPGSGRKKGTSNKATVLRVDAFFIENNIDPLQKLMELIPTLRGDMQAKVWLELYSYCHSKPKAEGDSQQTLPDDLRTITAEDIERLTLKASA